MGPQWFFRMARWARNPPSEKKVMLVFGIIVVCLAIAAIERWIGWPDAMSLKWVRP